MRPYQGEVGSRVTCVPNHERINRSEFKWFSSNAVFSPCMPPALSKLVAALAQFVDVLPSGNADHLAVPRDAAPATSNAASFGRLT